jgi:uncharacterized protein (TIGR02328 family)
MRLWHSKIIPLLDGRRLCDLHMSCCNLRGMGWGKRNKNINYIYDDPSGEEALAVYHKLVLEEMSKRGYKFEPRWLDPCYCGKRRPSRQYNHTEYAQVLMRDVPLRGHDLFRYSDDILTLQRRGLNIKLYRYGREDDLGWVDVYRASRGNEITYYCLRTEFKGVQDNGNR